MACSKDTAWMQVPDRAAYAKQLRALANLDAQRNTQDPAAAVDFLLWMADNYDRRTS
jgi:hypothetical protein